LLIVQAEEALQSAKEEFRLQVCVPPTKAFAYCHSNSQDNHACLHQCVLLKLPLGLQGVDLSNIATNPTEGKQAV